MICSAGVLNAALIESRAAAPAVTLTAHDTANLASITAAWNKVRAAERLGLPLAPEDVLRNVLEATSALVAEKDP